MSEREQQYSEWREGYGEPYVRPADAWDAGWKAAIQAERERCAKIAEERIQCNDLCEQCETAKSIAAAIRRGGEHEHNE